MSVSCAKAIIELAIYTMPVSSFNSC